VGATATEKTIRVFVKIEVDLEFPEYKKAMIVNLRKHSWFTYNRALDPALKPIAIGFFIRKDHEIAGKEFFKEEIQEKMGGTSLPFEIEERQKFSVRDDGKEIGSTKAIVVLTTNDYMTELEEKLLEAFLFNTTNQGYTFMSQCSWTVIGGTYMKELINLHHEYMQNTMRVQIFGIKLPNAKCIEQSGDMKSIRSWMSENMNLLEVYHCGNYMNLRGFITNQTELLKLRDTILGTLRTLIKATQQAEILVDQANIWAPSKMSKAVITYHQTINEKNKGS